MKRCRPGYILIAGPTASGKSALALELAQRCGGEIVNCDSVQFYRGFDIGSAKPNSEERARVVHHLLDIVSWSDDYDAACFLRDGRRAIEDVTQRGRIPIVVGGTGLYIRALWGYGWNDMPSDPELRACLKLQSKEQLYARLEDLDPRRAAELHPNDYLRLIRALEIRLLTGRAFHDQPQQELFPPALTVIMDPERDFLKQRIEQRVCAMLAEGLVDEVRDLLDQGCSRQCKPMQSIGYRQVAEFLSGATRYEDLYSAINIATRQYAKRQGTWFRKLPADLRLQVTGNQALATVLLRLDAWSKE